jgi:hypothetical protein
MGDNRKIFNKNCDKAFTDLKLREKRGWKFYVTNEVREIRCVGLTGEFYRENIVCPALTSSAV